MCGILGIVSSQPVAERLIAGLKRMEYRGYDSSGIAVIDDSGELVRRRAPGKLRELEVVFEQSAIEGLTGLGHTRWATHGRPSEANAHPHFAGSVGIVHNGIIENYVEIREKLRERSGDFESETDSEVIAHLINAEMQNGSAMTDAFARALKQLEGAFGLVAVCKSEPDKIWAARSGSPLVVGLGKEENFIGSDTLALSGLTNDVIYLEDGDWVCASRSEVRVFNEVDELVERQTSVSAARAGFVEKGEYRHFMLKEIHEQPEVLAHTVSKFVDAHELRFKTADLLDWGQISRLISSACGSAFYSLATAKYWFERYAQIPMEVDIASEFRYRSPIIAPGDAALFVSQSGETADTLAALGYSKQMGARTIGLINVADSSIGRDVDIALYTQAGPEIGVASTKAFTAQLAGLACLAIGAGVQRGLIDREQEIAFAEDLIGLPRLVGEALGLDEHINRLAERISNSRDVLYLGRGAFYPVALEGALKLKEISYIHAEGYAAGELKHGPIALVEEATPIVAIAPAGPLFGKTLSNIQEVIARGANIILITDPPGAEASALPQNDVVLIPETSAIIQPIVASIPAQLIAYYAAVLRGTDVDQPRNLAKSVTVE